MAPRGAPVSYTHLDVYKRQDQFRLAQAGQALQQDMPASQYANENQFNEILLTEQDPVSYTHLDVDKRQGRGRRPPPGLFPQNPHFPEVSLHPVRIARREPSGQWM